jgi:hypothetical protein
VDDLPIGTPVKTPWPVRPARAFASVLKIFADEVELEKDDNQDCVTGPSHGQQPCHQPPEFAFRIVGAAPHRNQNPDRVGHEAEQQFLAERDAVDIKADAVERDQRAARRDAVKPEDFPQRLFAAPRADLGVEKRRGEVADPRVVHRSTAVIMAGGARRGRNRT